MNEILKSLRINVFHINCVEITNCFKISNNNLQIKEITVNSNLSLIKHASVSVLNPFQRTLKVNTILDIVPISTKVYGRLGTGITNTLTGVYLLLTASKVDGQQFFNFGHCYGALNEKVVPNQIGTFNDSDYLIHIDVKVDDDCQDIRKAILQVHQCADHYLQNIREILKVIRPNECDETHLFEEIVKPHAKKVVMIKQIAGQGAMMDNLILPDEPSGVQGADSIIDLKNMPVILTPNEYRDGAIRALT